PPESGTRARKVEALVSPRQSRDKCICGRVLQNQHHERVTPVDTALKTISSVLTTAEGSRLRRRSSSRFASTLLHNTACTHDLNATCRAPSLVSADRSRKILVPGRPRCNSRHLLGSTWHILGPCHGRVTLSRTTRTYPDDNDCHPEERSDERVPATAGAALMR